MQDPGPADMNHVHQVVIDKYLKGEGVEGNMGIYARVQYVKQLMEE